MSTVSVKHFDFLSYVRKAREFGASEDLAELQARTIEEAIDVAISSIETKELATRFDFCETELRLKN